LIVDELTARTLAHPSSKVKDLPPAAVNRTLRRLSNPVLCCDGGKHVWLTRRRLTKVWRVSRTRIARRALALCAIALGASSLLAACERRGDPAPPEPAQSALDVSQPDGWDADVAMAAAVDLNPDPAVVEVEIEAKLAAVELLPGKKTMAWTYNGTIPGPMIRARVGDRVVVHFKNSLPAATTIHWHGIRVPNAMDGAPGVTQPAIEGGASFEYDFVVKDAGTYWYHPHTDSSVQVGQGLYGAFVVTDPNDPGEFGEDLVLVLSDASLAASGEFLPADSGGAFGDLFGREGSVVLVNGKAHPTLKVRSGKQQRWRIVNASRARYFSVGLRDHRFVRLGGDNGLAARSSDVYGLRITPGERADAVFTPADAPGSRRTLYWSPVNRGYGTEFARAREPILEIETVDLPAVTPAPIPSELRAIEPLDLAGATQRTINLTIDVRNNEVEMGIDGRPHWKATAIEARVGETQIWRIVNDTAFSHPFHLHGYFFQVLDEARIPEWKDTVDVPTKSELKIAVAFDERPGMWMYHCHILDHAEAGMMGHLHVLP
jgi:FtsP/CotA-like multicopper oxidase with cupredoxin domain